MSRSQSNVVHRFSKLLTGTAHASDPVDPSIFCWFETQLMEALGSAASVIAVLELSAKLASLCLQYLSALKNAKTDIERLRGELGRLNVPLEGARQLLEGPNGDRLLFSQQVRAGLDGCSSQLGELHRTLETELSKEKGQNMMSKFGLRALKWPFKTKDIDRIISTIERYRDTLSAALTVDLAYVQRLRPGD